MRISIILLLACMVFFACEDVKEDRQLDEFGYDYYPVELGKYWIYQVDSVTYSDLGAIKDSTTSFLREELVEKFVDQLGDTVFRIERDYSRTSDYDWKVRDQWATHVESQRMTRTEENLKYIKMVFPAKVGVSWDGNNFINPNTVINVGGEMLDLFIDWEYRILSISENEEIAGVTYEDVITIQNADSDLDDLLHRRYVVEKYAKNIGLIQVKHVILDTQCILECEGQTWEEKGEQGYVMTINLIEHGG